jgi:general secretion pathway protein E
LCPHCKKPSKVDAEAWVTMIHPWDLDPPEKLYNKVGCLECRNTGYHGRTGVYEIMPINSGLRTMIKEKVPAEVIAKESYRLGMQPLRLSIANLLKSGKTSLEEALKLVPPEYD